jgi:hypothetical protein
VTVASYWLGEVNKASAPVTIERRIGLRSLDSACHRPGDRRRRIGRWRSLACRGVRMIVCRGRS